MIDRTALLKDLRPVVTKLADDLRTRLKEHRPSAQFVEQDYQQAVAAKRTAQTYQTFADDHLTQVAVAWVLATVFVRFLEDNQLCDEPWISGPGKRLSQARDRYTDWLRQNTQLSDRDYLLHVFSTLGKLPGLAALLGERNALLHRIGPTADGASMLRQFWQQLQGEGLAHDFGNAEWDTRFLGDLYQDLSEAAQKKFALLQTPDFVEEFILDKTLEPALAEFGLAETRMIDPSCGSGHFLLGGFARLYARWQQKEPGTQPQVLAQRALDAVAGVDLNPFAVAIARFRLLVAALKVCGVTRLKDAFDFRTQVVNGDSLLHGPGLQGSTGKRQKSLIAEEEAEFAHVYASEDRELLREVFGRRYQAVVGNPPYILARDKALNDQYRNRYPGVCHRKYSLGVPFTALFFELARPGRDEKRAAGFVGMITANSFMKREFGSKLIEEYLNARVELNGVLDLSGAYIPGHGTPTVILLGRARTAVSTTIRAVLGIKGEPSTPEDPAKGLVWSAIVGQCEQPGSESDYVSCADVERDRFATHPWSIGGGGAAELKELIEESCSSDLKSVVGSVGVMAVTGEDDAYTRPRPSDMRRLGLPFEHERVFCEGDVVRDWSLQTSVRCMLPYDDQWRPKSTPVIDRALWMTRAQLQQGVYFGQTKEQRGMKWWEFGIVVKGSLRTPLSIAFAFVATHNHFVLDRGGKVFKQSAPVIKLPAGSSEDDHLGLLGLLNSSVACFWCQQVMHNKGGPGGGSSKDEKWHDFYEFAGTALGPFPVPEGRPLAIARRLDASATRLRLFEPRSVLDGGERTRSGLDKAKAKALAIRAEMVFLQEEIDWFCSRLYGLIDDDLTYHGVDVDGLQVGERAFEMVMAKQVVAGKLQTKWFEWLHATAITEVPRTWPKAYRELVQRRVSLIQSNRDLALVEQVQSKRRWESEPWEKIEKAACASWLLDRMEGQRFWPNPKLVSTARFAELLRQDSDFVQVAKLYRGRDDFDFDALVRELVESESVPFLPVLRYKESGLRKRSDWEAVWELQRKEDRGEQVGAIPVPPKYASADFLKSSYWSLRGKLDVPKERFISYPHTERSDDPTPVFTWAGFDHAQQAQALAAYYLERKEQDGATVDALVPLLAGLRELLPWLHQWHAAPTDEAPDGVAAAYQDFFSNELRGMGLAESALVAWKPSARGGAQRARKES